MADPLENLPDRVGANPMTVEEKQRISQLLQDGMSQAEVAREVGRSPAAVRKVFQAILRDTKLDHVTYDKKQRLRLVNLTFARYEQLISLVSDGHQFRSLVDGLRLLCDVQRVEEGLDPESVTQPLEFTITVKGTDVKKTMEHDDIVDGEILTDPVTPKDADKEESEYDPLADI